VSTCPRGHCSRGPMAAHTDHPDYVSVIPKTAHTGPAALYRLCLPPQDPDARPCRVRDPTHAH
jgi:hypothetical protein